MQNCERYIREAKGSFLICENVAGRWRCVIATITRHPVSLWYYNRRHRLTSECYSPNEFQVFVGGGRAAVCKLHERRPFRLARGGLSQRYSVISSDSWTTSASISHPFRERRRRGGGGGRARLRVHASHSNSLHTVIKRRTRPPEKLGGS